MHSLSIFLLGQKDFSESLHGPWLRDYTVRIRFSFKYFYRLDGTYKQNIYLLERENFAPMQIFALL